MSNARKPDLSDQDFAIEISANSLRNARQELSRITRNRLRFSELFLAIASLAMGSSLTALQNGISPQSPLWWMFYTILPAVALGSLVAFILLTQLSSSEPAEKAMEVLRLLPNPDQAMPIFEEYQRLAGSWSLESTTATSAKTSTGVINIHVTRTRIKAAGLLYGESDTPIGDLESRICQFQPETKQLLLIYRLSAHNDNGKQVVADCVLSGIVFETEDPGGMLIKANWFHLQEGPSGTAPSGTAYLTLSPPARS